MNRRTNKMSHRLEVRVQTGGPDFTLTFFVPYKGMADSEQARMPVGARGMFTGKVTLFNRSWQLSSPHAVIFGGGDGDEGPRGPTQPSRPASRGCCRSIA